MEANPRAVFERLFGVSDSTDSKVRLSLMRKNRSVLDSVIDKVVRLQSNVAADDRIRLNRYLDAVRDVEQRCRRRSAGRSRTARRRSASRHSGQLRGACEAPVRPAGVGVPDGHDGVAPSCSPVNSVTTPIRKSACPIHTIRCRITVKTPTTWPGSPSSTCSTFRCMRIC